MLITKPSISYDFCNFSSTYTAHRHSQNKENALEGPFLCTLQLRKSSPWAWAGCSPPAAGCSSPPSPRWPPPAASAPGCSPCYPPCCCPACCCLPTLLLLLWCLHYISLLSTFMNLISTFYQPFVNIYQPSITFYQPLYQPLCQPLRHLPLQVCKQMVFPNPNPLFHEGLKMRKRCLIQFWLLPVKLCYEWCGCALELWGGTLGLLSH